MEQLPLKALRVFVSVARLGSFKAAAEQLCVSQSAVSHQIKHLEDWLGRPLFDRTGHRPQLLEHAHVLSNALQSSLQDIETACRQARCSSEPTALVIASIPSVSICWLIPRLSDFQIRHPDINTRMVYALHGRDINFNEVDLAFVFADSLPDVAGQQAQLFQAGVSVPVCSPALHSKLDHHSLEESIMKAGLMHDSDYRGWTEWLDQTALDPATPIAGPIFEDFNLLRAATLAGQGIALCPLALIGNDIASKRLVQLSDVAVNQNYNYYLVNRDTTDPKTVLARECFKSWVFDMLKQDASKLNQVPG